MDREEPLHTKFAIDKSIRRLLPRAGGHNSCPFPSVPMRTTLLSLLITTVLSSRPKRYAIEGSFWGVRTVTYKFATPCSSLSLEQLERVFKRAFDVWEEKSGLTFKYSPGTEVHIDIIFASGSHGDGEPFDGQAHAFFPRYGGDLHFDDDEIWSEDKSGLDLFACAVHEIGHSLGLKHSHDPTAIMAPFYHTYTGDSLHLTNDDLLGIERLYGIEGVAKRKLGIAHGSQKPEICSDGRLDAITQISNGSVYAFQGDFFWRIENYTAAENYPMRIQDVWGISGPVDAAMTNANGHTYIFKVDYYIFDRDCKLLEGYPKLIRKGLIDLPDNIGAATAWHDDGQPYFFKDNKFWRYSRWGMDSQWPKHLSEIFKNGKSPKKIDAALYLRGIGTFLFVGDKYWQISGKRKHIIFPRSTSDDWFSCKRSLEN